MYGTTGSGIFTSGLTRELGEEVTEDWCKKENKFRRHRAEYIHTELLSKEGFEIVIDWERKGSRIEYRLDVLWHEASFDGRSREEVLSQFEEWLDSKVFKANGG